MNTSSPAPFGCTDRPGSAWTNLSLTLAVSWMLTLAFGTTGPSPTEHLAPRADPAYKTLEVGLFTGLPTAAHEAAARALRVPSETPAIDG